METLPVELLHRIFDNLDIETLFFSIRPVSKLFASIFGTYDRFVFNSKLMTRTNFYVLCRWIKPQNIISLTLSNDEQTSNQIELFLFHVHLREFTRLRSLTLLHIDEYQLNFILERVNLNGLTSFSFSFIMEKYVCRRMNKTNNLLASTLAHSNLRQLEFDMTTERMSEFSWSFNCSIQYLIINNSTTIDYLLTILQSSPHLHTIVIKKKFDEYNMTNRIPKLSSLVCFQQLKSFTIEELDMTINKLESFLLLTPSLIYLKLIGRHQMLDGKRWEQFIEQNLSHLDKFEFFFIEQCEGRKSLVDFELILASFQTPFWLEHKKWFVTCEYDIDYSGTIHLYSIPICKTSLQYNPIWKMLPLSTCISTRERQLTIMNNIKSLILTLDKVLADDLREKKSMTTQPLFPNVTELSLQFYQTGPIFPLQLLPMMINISHIVQLELKGCFSYLHRNSLVTDIGIFLQQAHSLSSLTIQSSLDGTISSRIFDSIYSIPFQLKYLRITINSLDQMKMLFDKFEKLSIIICDEQWNCSNTIIQWINDNTIDSTCKQDHGTVTAWLGKKKIQSNDIKVDNKRIKLIENQFDLL